MLPTHPLRASLFRRFLLLFLNLAGPDQAKTGLDGGICGDSKVPKRNRLHFPSLLALQVAQTLIVWTLAVVKIGRVLPDPF